MTCEDCKTARRDRALRHYGAMLKQLENERRSPLARAGRWIHWFLTSPDTHIDGVLIWICAPLATAGTIIVGLMLWAQHVGLLR